MDYQVGAGGAEKDLERCRKMVDDAVRTATETRTILARIREHLLSLGCDPTLAEARVAWGRVTGARAAAS